MAKSKSGGTRSFIRGKIGADVYSVGKDGKGAKQQVVRSLAEVVSNPQTVAQMRGRMIMSTVMQTVSALSPIIDHSFDNVPNGQPSISEFISRNYALVKADVAVHPTSGNVFGLNKYQEKGSKGGAYIISSGQVQVSENVYIMGTEDNTNLYITLPTSDITIGALKAVLGLAGGDYVTLVAILNNGSLGYCRAYLNSDLADSIVITSENKDSIFTFDNNIAATVSLDNNTLGIAITSDVLSVGFILSKKVGSSWNHSTSKMSIVPVSMPYSADVALPTYPQGASRFLNGGDI